MYTYEKKEKQGVLKVEISAQEFEKAVELAYESNKGKYNIQGFRKGKAPRKVIEKTYGDTVFFDDAFEQAISDEFRTFLTENEDVSPAAAPSVEMDSFTRDKGIVATLRFDLMPDVKLGALNNLKVKKEAVKVDDKQVQEDIQRAIEAHARYVESESAAEEGDFATIDFVGSCEGVKFEGGEAKDYRLELGSHTFIEGFEEQVIGMKKGEKKDINVTFPANYQAQNLKGKPAVFEVTVNKIEKKVLPEFNDKFVADTTEFENVEEYKKEIKARLIKRGEEVNERNYENALIDELVKNSEVEVPNSMIEHELHHMTHDFEHRLSHQGLNLETYLQYLGQTMEEFENERKVDAEKNIKTRLVLQQLIKQHSIKVSAEEIDKKIQAYAGQYQMEGEELKKTLSPEDYAYFENDALMSKVIELLKNSNKKN